MQPNPQPPTVRHIVIETPIPGVLLGQPPVLLPEPEDPELGHTTDEDGGW